MKQDWKKQRVLSGISALTLLESAIGEGFATSFPFGDTGPARPNLFGRLPLTDAKGPGTLSYISGLALTGLRASALVSEGELIDNHSLLLSGVRHRLSFLVHLASSSSDPGRFWEGLYSAGETGAFQMVSANGQESVDFCLMAHRIAELGLLPGIHGIDAGGRQNQTVEFLSRDEIVQFLGDPDDGISSPTPSQEMLFGKRRRRIPQWFNLDLPSLQGADKDPFALACERVSQEVYLDSHLLSIIEETMKDFGKLTGREYSPLSGYQMADAEYVLLVQGALYHKILPVVDFLRSQNKKVGCLKLSLLRPFPGARLAALLEGKKGVTLLEPLSVKGGSPLFRDVSLSLRRAEENGLENKKVYPSYPTFKPGASPLIYGGNWGPQLDDLSTGYIQSAFENMWTSGKRQFYLGLEVYHSQSSFPKQEILLQNLLRDYPGLPDLALKKKENLKGSSEGLFVEIALAQREDRPFEEFCSLLEKAFGLSLCGRKKNNLLQVVFSKETPLYEERPRHVLFASLQNLDKSLLSRMREGGTLVLMVQEEENPALLSDLLEEILRKKLTLRILRNRDFSLALLLGSLVEILPGMMEKEYKGAKVLDRILDHGREFGRDGSSPLFDEASFKEALGKGKEGLVEIALEDLGTVEKTPTPEPSMALRRYLDQGPPYSRLSNFYDHVHYFYLRNKREELVADPFAALPVIPAGTAHFQDMSSQGEALPKFYSEKCTGCAQCFIHCPHSALPPVVLSCESILKGAVDMAAESGKRITKLIPTIKNLAKVANRVIQNKKNNGETVQKMGDFLPGAFEKMAEQMNLDEKAQKEYKKDFDEIMEILETFPVAVTECFFEELEAQKKGTGELFSLALDPQACTGCGVCAALCPEEALSMAPQKEQNVQVLRDIYRIWERLPDTSNETIRRMGDRKDYPSFGALLLSRNFYTSMMGGEISNQGLSEKGLLHLTTALVETLVQPNLIRQIGEIDTLVEKLKGQIKAPLEKAVSPENFSSLAQVLSRSKEKKVSLDKLLEEIGEVEKIKTLELEPLKRKLALMESLQDLKWILSEGPTGLGRSRFGITMAKSHSLKWAREFPANPFCSPVLVQWEKETPHLTAGIFQGLLRHFLDNLRLLRRARLEAEGKYNPHEHDLEIASLHFEALTEEERSLFSPLILVGDGDFLAEQNLSSLSHLLSGDLPVKVVLFDHSLAEGKLPERFSSRISRVALLAMAHRNAFVHQSSIGNIDHLFRGLVKGMTFSGPALFHLMAPLPLEEGFAPEVWPDLSLMALEARVFPCFTFDPHKEGVFGNFLSLEGNSNPDGLLNRGKLGDGEILLSFATWALTQHRFRSHFTALGPEEEGTVPLEEILFSSPSSWQGKVPRILWKDGKGGIQSYGVSSLMVRATENSLAFWKVLQELSGRVTPFTEDLKGRLSKEIEKERREELEKIKGEYEGKLKGQEDEFMRQTLQKLKGRLLHLSGYKK